MGGFCIGFASSLSSPSIGCSGSTLWASHGGKIGGNGQALAYVYSRDHASDALIANVLTIDEARRIAANIAKLPKLLAKADPLRGECGKPSFGALLTSGRKYIGDCWRHHP